MSRDLAASVRARLLNLAKAEQSDFNQVLVRYTLERLLYRLSQSRYADQFLLKGALLFTLWYDMPHRMTRDVDLLGFGASDLETITETFRIIAAVVCDDGIVFDPSSVRTEEIRKSAGYGGARVHLTGNLAGAHCAAQVDIGFGDAVTPGSVLSVYPVLLKDFPSPRIRTYPVYTVIAEKLHAIALLGMTNTRLKDYLDLYIVLDREVVDTAILADAIAATFARRGMAVPGALPGGLTEAFATDPSRQALWLAFLRKNDLPSLSLGDIIRGLQDKVEPALRAAKIAMKA